MRNNLKSTNKFDKKQPLRQTDREEDSQTDAFASAKVGKEPGVRFCSPRCRELNSHLEDAPGDVQTPGRGFLPTTNSTFPLPTSTQPLKGLAKH